MATKDPYGLPFALPAGAILLGPPGWAPAAGEDPVAPLVGDFDAAAALAGRETSPAGEPPVAGAGAACLLLHGGHLGVGGRAGEVASALQSFLAARPAAAAILLYDALDADGCARLFQAGLFAALPVPLERERWDGLLERIARHQRRWGEIRSLRRQGEETTQLLHAHRRQLQEQVALVGEELISSQRRLERANRDLTDHMAQLALLYKFGRDLSAARNWDATLAGLLESLAGFVGARGAALVLRAAAEAPCRPRSTFGWEESAWDKVLLRLEDQVRDAAAGQILTPGVFQFDASPAEAPRPARGVTALPLEHQGLRLGYLLLLDCAAARGEGAARHLPFLQAVQVILAEEVAGAQMLDRIRELGAFNARVLETVRSGIWVVDEQARTVYCNRSGRRLLGAREAGPAADGPAGAEIGRGRGAVVGGALEALRAAAAPGEALPELFLDGLLRLPDVDGSPFARLFARGEAAYQGEGRIVRPGGEAVPVLVQSALMPGRGQGESWLVLVAEDLREAKRLEAERVRADNLEGMVEMSATLAHEIRNPLMGLSAQAELLAGHLPAEDPRRRYLDVITAEVERINGTINRLLHFVRPYEPRLAPASLPDLARDCLLLVGERARERGARLALRVDPPGGEASAWEQPLDAGQIKQVLLNLLLNALDAAPAGSEVELRLARGRFEVADGRRGSGRLAEGATVEVVDRGPGFPAADAETLFRPFYTTKSAGTGLGLSICRKIVAAHGGEIRAERREGATVFRVLLPRATAAERAQRQEAS